MASTDLSFLSLLHDDVKCAFCLGQLKAPRVLTCMHSFCVKCLESLQDQNRTRGRIACPVCQEETVLQDSGIAGLKHDFRAITLIERLEREKGKQQEMEAPKCEVCGGIDSEGSSSYISCLECEQVMCKQCGILHKKMKSSQSHTLTAISSTTKPVVCHEDPDNADEAGLCEKHNGEKMVLFCSTCLTPVCQECSDDDHCPKDNHECIPVEQYAPVMRGEILSRLSKVPQLSAEDIEVIALVDNAEEYVKNFDNKMQAAFTRSTDRWRADLIHKKEKIFYSPMQTVGQVRLKAKEHLEDLNKIQIQSKEVLMKSKQYSLASTFKELRDSLDTLLCETPDRNSVEAISKSISRLEFHVNDEKYIWSLLLVSLERRNISVNAVDGPYAVAFTRDGRLAVSAEFEGPKYFSNKKSYYENYGDDCFSEEPQEVWDKCKYYAIKQTNATFHLAVEFGMEKRLESRCRALSSLSDLRFAVLCGNQLYGQYPKISLLNEKCTCMLAPDCTIPDIAVDLEDNIYYSYPDSKQIRTIRPDGTQTKPISTGYLKPWRAHRIAVCPPCGPYQIVFTHDSSKVSVIDLNGKLLRTITRSDWKDVAIGCDNKKMLYVLWKNSVGLRTLQRFTTEGHLLDTLFEAESHSCSELLLAVSPGGSAAVVTDVGESGNVTVISTKRKVDLENYNV